MNGTLKKGSNGMFILFGDKNQVIATYATKLSLKNCQDIENGYDLDELSENYALERYDKVSPDEDYEDYSNFVNRKHNFEKGFQKAMELMEGKLPKQTEWEVAISEELDKDRCLILKRIEL